MLEILKWPDKRMVDLEVQRVTEFNSSLKELCDGMADLMISYNGVGLAATQVGDSRAVFILNTNLIDDMEDLDYMAFCNPELIDLSKEKETGIEGCLSFPKEKAIVTRSLNLTLKARSIEDIEISVKCFDFLARAVQHETDHLNHIYIIDHAGKMKKKMMEKRVARLAKLSGKKQNEKNTKK